MNSVIVVFALLSFLLPVADCTYSISCDTNEQCPVGYCCVKQDIRKSGRKKRELVNLQLGLCQPYLQELDTCYADVGTDLTWYYDKCPCANGMACVPVPTKTEWVYPYGRLGICIDGDY